MRCLDDTLIFLTRALGSFGLNISYDWISYDGINYVESSNDRISYVDVIFY